MTNAASRSGGQRASERNAEASLNAKGQAQLSRVLYWRSFINIALMLCDAAMFILAGAIVVGLHEDQEMLSSWRFEFTMPLAVYLIIAAVIWVLSLRTVGIYHRHVMGDGYQLNMLLFKGACWSWVCLCALNYLLNLTITLTGLTLMVGAAWVATTLERVLTRWFITRSRAKGAYAYGTVVVGSPEGIGRTLKYLARKAQLNYRPVAVCPIMLDASGRVVPDSNVGELNQQMLHNWGRKLPVLRYSDYDLGERFVNMRVQTVMVCDVLRRFSDNFDIFSVRMESLGLELALITSAADASGHETQVRSLQGTTVLTLRLPQYSLSVRFVKRLFDLVVSSLAIVLSLIVTVPVAVAIRMEDHGPVFYTQERVGLRGRPFRMIKFRSMVTNADELKAKLAKESGQENRFIFKMKNDPRITHVGHFIRRFSIDELPQFLNVFKGDMSVVGPRPPLPEEYARYNQVYATRMLVKPGITGPWQVSGRSDLSAEESEQLDVAYVQSWSILGDIVIMFRTVGAVLGHKGAY